MFMMKLIMCRDEPQRARSTLNKRAIGDVSPQSTTTEDAVPLSRSPIYNKDHYWKRPDQT